MLEDIEFVVVSVVPASEPQRSNGAAPWVSRVCVRAMGGTRYSAELTWKDSVSAAPKVGDKFVLAEKKARRAG